MLVERMGMNMKNMLVSKRQLWASRNSQKPSYSLISTSAGLTGGTFLGQS